jgi:GNAT superfamily N-acetyltransferase
MSQGDDLVEVRLLDPSDDRKAFRSGNIDLDRFFVRYAGQNQFRHHIGTTWVAVRQGQIVGFATVSAAHLEVGDLPETLRKGLPGYAVPVLRLARLAVAGECHGQGIGRLLLRMVFSLAWRMANDFGCLGVLVDAKPEAVDFYDKLGFIELQHRQGALGDRPEPKPMFAALTAIPKPE